MKKTALSIVLSLMFVTTVWAGDIPGGGKSDPPPPPPCTENCTNSTTTPTVPEQDEDITALILVLLGVFVA